MFLACLFAVALSVWCVPFVERARIPMLCAALLIVGTIFGPPFFAVDGPIQLSLDRVLFAVLCLIAFFSLRGETVQIPALTRSDLLVIAYVVLVLVSTFFDSAPPRTSPIGTWLFYILMPAVLYAIARFSRLENTDLLRVESAMLVLGTYLALTGICEARGWYSLVFPRFVADPDHWEFLGRARGPLLNPSANGIVMTISLAIAALRWQRAERVGRLGYGILSIVMLGGLYSTLTRSVWMGAILALAIVFWQVTPRWFKVLSFVSCLLLAAFAVAGLKDQLLRMKRDKNLSAVEAEKSVQLRPLLAIVAYEMVKDAPVLGHGFGHYLHAARPYYSVRGYGLPIEKTRGYQQHNVLLGVAVNNGLLGLGIFGGLLILWLRTGWSIASLAVLPLVWRHMGLAFVAGIAGYLVGGMFQDVTIMPMINMFLFFMAGLAITMSQQARTVLVNDAPRRIPVFNAPTNGDQEIAVVGTAFQPAAS